VADKSDAVSAPEPAEQPPEEMSLADALQFAVRIHRDGYFDNAEKIYRKVLEVVPEQPDALNFLAMIVLHRGRVDDAIALMRRSLAADPAHGDRYNNLGNMLLAAERIDEAAAAYEEAAARSPETAAAHNNLGILYRAQGRFDDAQRAYERAVELEPNNAEAWNNYGNLYATRGQPREALRHYGKAILLRPNDRTTRQSMALAYVAVDDLEAAAGIYREWLKEQPDDSAIKHLLAAVSGEGIPARASDDYIEKTFDNFAATFDAKLTRLEYRAPQLVAGAVQKAGMSADKRLTVLDVGCGTGLCGPLLAPYAARLDGVDLSAGMLDGARKRGVYDELVKAELTQFLESRRETYDVIVSADTLCYFGALDDALCAAAGALRPNGCLVFTVEEADPAAAPQGHRINPHGRYSHTREYLKRTLVHAGFAEPDLADDVLRQEACAPVKGFVVTARKAA
jgi:predicted TPR repeat methyltransferase